MNRTANPFRPGAGHPPPYLAGREAEKQIFERLLRQDAITENLVLTGLRGSGKTVLLDSLKHLAMRRGWLWTGADINESASVNEANLATRLCADLAIKTSAVVVSKTQSIAPGFTSEPRTFEQGLGFDALKRVFAETPGLPLDKLKAAVEFGWNALADSDSGIRGIIFAYDEAQNLSDHAEKDQFPLSLLLDAFQSMQRKGLPLMLALTGLPTLYPKLVDSRTYAERMFRSVILESLSGPETRDAILKPVEGNDQVTLSKETVEAIVRMSGGYPYFIQFICREVYDAFTIRPDRGRGGKVPVREIEEKLDADFFSGRWSRATDRQRELLSIIAGLESCEDEFSVSEIVEKSRSAPIKPFSASNVSQMLAALAEQGLLYRNRHGKYTFSVPLFGAFIRRQESRAIS